MRKLNNFMILVMAFAATTVFAADHDNAKSSGAAAHPYTAKTPKLNRAQLDALLAKPEQLVIIDVRRPDELSRVGGFPVYLSIQNKDVEKSLDFIPKDRSLVTVSNHAGRAGKSADLLAAKGFRVVGAVGAQDYEAEGGTLTKIVPPAPKPLAENTH